MDELEDEDEVPQGMMTNGRPPIKQFNANEVLYRRIPADSEYFDFDHSEIEMDAIELPDMSVNRSSLGEMEWVLIGHPNAGVSSFKVSDIPAPIQHGGVLWYSFFPVHRPLKRNWPHTQVEAYEAASPLQSPSDDKHIDGKAKMLHPDAHYRWRYQLLCKMQVEIPPTRMAEDDSI